jgi:hypothetical protein
VLLLRDFLVAWLVVAARLLVKERGSLSGDQAAGEKTAVLVGFEILGF